MDLHAVLDELAQVRPIFRSEADFQHALGWRLHEKWPTLKVRLELRPPSLDRRSYVDIWLQDDSARCAVEVKYKTKPLSIMVNGEQFDLLDQGGQDQGMYDFRKDVGRDENLASGRQIGCGFVVLLTNDARYWNPPRHAQIGAAAFGTHEGREVSGSLAWGRTASPGTRRGRDQPIVIRGPYRLSWRTYSTVGAPRHSQFRYLLLKVPSHPT